jgi:hypothetical protein
MAGGRRAERNGDWPIMTLVRAQAADDNRR